MKHHVTWHETCACKCRLGASVCYDKQCWNSDKCKYDCNKLIDKGEFDGRFVWNPGICECEYLTIFRLCKL